MNNRSLDLSVVMTEMYEHSAVNKLFAVFSAKPSTKITSLLFDFITQKILILFKTLMTFLIVLILNSVAILNYNGDFVTFQIAFEGICWLVFHHHKIAFPKQTFLKYKLPLVILKTKQKPCFFYLDQSTLANKL